MRATRDLLERETELDALRSAFAAEGDRGTLVTITAAPGLGKTALLAHAARLAREHGFAVHRARGSDLTGDVPFAAAQELLPGADTLIACARSLAERAQRTPVALLVDDAQWIDPQSGDLLEYVASRGDAPAVVLVVAARARSDVIVRIEQAADGTAVRLRPGPLGADAVGQLVGERLGAPVAGAFAAAARAATGGNPFLVGELAREAAARGIRPEEAGIAALRDIGPIVIAQRALARLARSAPDAVALARAVSVLGDGASMTDSARLSGLAPDAALAAVAALSAEGVLAEGLPLRFAQPIVGQAIAAEQAAAERAALHARAAVLLHEAGAPAGAVAAQLLRTEPGAAGPWAAAVLREVAANARARGAPAVASAALRRALAEPPPDETLERELGLAAWEAGEADAVVHLRAVHTRARGPLARARSALDLAPALITTGAVPGAVTVLREARADLGDLDPELEAEIVAQVSAIAALDGAATAAVLPGLERQADARVASPVGRRMMANVAQWVAMSGGSARQVQTLARRALDDGLLLEEAGPRSAPFLYAVALLIQADAFAEADAHLERAYAIAEERASGIGCATTSMLRSLSAYRQGALDRAAAEARAATDGAELHGWELGLPATVGFLVDALIERGDLDAAREALERYDAGAHTASGMLHHAYLVARGRLRLARREFGAAIADLEELGRQTSGREWSATIGSPTFRSYLAQALAAAGDHERAAELAAEELELARRWGAARGIGMAQRLVGVLSVDQERITRLQDAVTTLAGSGAALEHARALADLGATLRRDGLASAAREPLAAALDEAERCGAEPLAVYAHEELAATGARRRRDAPRSGTDALTPSERRTARLAADGLSNVEIARALFLTRKTIEMHLTQVYRKLGIASRAELPAALADQVTSSAS